MTKLVKFDGFRGDKMWLLPTEVVEISKGDYGYCIIRLRDGTHHAIPGTIDEVAEQINAAIRGD